MAKIIDFEAVMLIGFDHEQADHSVGLGESHCLIFKDDKGNHIQIDFGEDVMDELIHAFTPLVENIQAQIQFDREMFEEEKRRNKHEKKTKDKKMPNL